MYNVYLDDVLLPVTPSAITTRIKNQNKTISLLNEGQVNIIKPPGLAEYSFSALLPQQKYPFAQYPDGFKTASFYLKKLKTLKEEMKPFRFIISRKSPTGKSFFSTNIRVTLEDYSVIENAKNGGDIEVDISLLKYADYGTVKVNITQSKDNVTVQEVKERPDENAPKAQTYTVVAGDCLWMIAKRFLNDGERYPEIYSLNQELIDGRNKGTGNSKYTIYPGQVFTLPV